MRKKTIGYARRLHLSFLLILLIPILVSFILYLYAVHQANEQSDRLHESLLSKVQADMDARLLSVRSVGSRLYIDSDVRALASVSGEMESSHAMAQVRLYQELNSLVLSSENLDGLFIYFPLTNKVISTNGNMDLSMFYSLYYENSALTEDAFHTLLSSDHRYDMHMLPAKGGSIQPLMLLSLPPDSSSTLAPSIAMLFSPEMLRLQLGLEEFANTETRLLLHLEDGSLYSPTGSLIRGSQFEASHQGNVTTQFDGVPVRALERPSEQTNMQYLMLTPVSRIHEDVRKLQMVIILGLLLSIIGGLLLSRHLTARNSNPIAKLLATISSGNREASPDSGVDELVWASGEVERLYQHSLNNEQLLRDSRLLAHQYSFLQLLTKGSIERSELCDIELSGPCFGVVILKIMDAGDISPSELGLRTSILRKLFEENIKDRYTAEALEWGNAVIALISLPNVEITHLTAIREASENVQTLVESTLHFTCTVSIGPIAESMDEIPAAYRSAQELEEYLDLLDTSTISILDVENLSPQYDFSLEDEEKLQNAVSIGDEETAIALMQDIFDRNRRARIGMDLYMCLVYTMAGVLLKGANHSGIRNAAQQLNFPAALMNTKPGAEMESVFTGFVQAICQEIARAKSDTDGEAVFCQRLEAFIHEHFTDPDLNISQVAQHFDLTPAYLSTRYKRQTGRSLLDFINTLRLNYAEDLLKTGMTVTETAERSGFRDSGSLIRAFKKKKGITPGQVRQQGDEEPSA